MLGEMFRQSQPYRSGYVWLAATALLWLVICLLAASDLGAIVGFFAGWGVLIVGIPLMLLGLGPAIPAFLIAALAAAYLAGGSLILAGLLSPQRRSMAFGGIHIAGATAALQLCFASLERAF